MNFMEHMPTTIPVYKAIRRNGYAHHFVGGHVREACRWTHADWGWALEANLIPMPRFAGVSNPILDEINA